LEFLNRTVDRILLDSVQLRGFMLTTQRICC